MVVVENNVIEQSGQGSGEELFPVIQSLIIWQDA